MKRAVLILAVLAVALVLLTGCAAKPAYVIDFEDESIFVFKTANFDEAFTEEAFDIAPADGFKGNAFKGSVKAQAEGTTWWVAGMAFSPDASKDVSFENLGRVTFDYKSSVDYSGEVPFMVQMVWKDVASGEAVAMLQVDFPIDETDKVKTFEIEVPEETRSDLNGASGYYFDWLMIGLEGNADDLFNPGAFYIDNISFFPAD